MLLRPFLAKERKGLKNAIRKLIHGQLNSSFKEQGCLGFRIFNPNWINGAKARAGGTLTCFFGQDILIDY